MFKCIVLSILIDYLTKIGYNLKLITHALFKYIRTKIIGNNVYKFVFHVIFLNKGTLYYNNHCLLDSRQLTSHFALQREGDYQHVRGSLCQLNHKYRGRVLNNATGVLKEAKYEKAKKISTMKISTNLVCPFILLHQCLVYINEIY